MVSKNRLASYIPAISFGIVVGVVVATRLSPANCSCPDIKMGDYLFNQLKNTGTATFTLVETGQLIEMIDRAHPALVG